MIRKDIVKNIVDEWLSDKEYFLTSMEISADNKITIEIDHKDGVWIDDCVELSRFVESHLSRDDEDYDLEVGSAGIGQPFKVLQQYYNHLGGEVEVLTSEGKKLIGILKDANEKNFVLSIRKKEKIGNDKRPKLIVKDVTFEYNEIKYTKYLIHFK